MNFSNYFFEAIQLAKKVKGNTSPNPAVGCVIVKNGKIIGEGATQKAGGDHAEIAAIKNAGDAVKDASLYVTLEPCVNYPGKRTQSCAEAIIKAGIKEVFAGQIDPNPKVNGRGFETLRKAGIMVTILDTHKKEIAELNEDFFKYIQTKLPFVTLKAAMTLDGNIAAAGGDSRWISCEESRRWVHAFRNRSDAVMVGIGTVIQDNPELTVRMVPFIKNPLRVIIDPYGQTPPESHVMQDEFPTLFLTGKKPSDEFKNLCSKKGKEIKEFELKNGISLSEAVKYLGKEKNIESLLIEGGSHVFYRAVKEGIADKIALFIAPKLLGGRGIPLLDGIGPDQMSKALRLERVSAESIGEDILIQGYFNRSGNETGLVL